MPQQNFAENYKIHSEFAKAWSRSRHRTYRFYCRSFLACVLVCAPYSRLKMPTLAPAGWERS